MLNIFGAFIDMASFCLFIAAWHKSRKIDDLHSFSVSIFIPILFLALFLEKFFNLDLLIQVKFRALTNVYKYYGQRRYFQGVTVFAISMIGFCLMKHVVTKEYSHSLLRLAYALALLLGAFDVIRLISLHTIDAVLFASIGPLRINHILEGALTGSIVLCALPFVFGRLPPNPRGRNRQSSRPRSIHDVAQNSVSVARRFKNH